jgi:hypothetical protein
VPFGLLDFDADTKPTATTITDTSAGVNFTTLKVLKDFMYVMFESVEDSGVFDDGPYWITNVGTTTLTIDNVGGERASVNFRIYYEFAQIEPYAVQWCVGVDTVYLVDTSEVGILKFDGKVLTRLPMYGATDGDACPFAGAAAINFVNGYLIVGNTTETAATGGYRTVRWSMPLATGYFDANDYVSLTLSIGPIFSIKSIEDYLVVSTQDDIYVGKPNRGDSTTFYTLPWIFKRLEARGRVPAGQFAIISVLNSIFYIGPDDIYTLSFKELNAQGDFVVTPLQCKIRNQIFTGVELHKSRIMYEPISQVLLFSFDRPFTSVVVLSLRTGEWSTWTYKRSFSTMKTSFFARNETYATMLEQDSALLGIRHPVTYGPVPAGWVLSSGTAPTAGDTVTVGTVTYSFVAALSVPAVANEVVIEATAALSFANLVLAVNGTASDKHSAAAANVDAYALQGLVNVSYPGNELQMHVIGFVENSTVPLACSGATLSCSGATLALDYSVGDKSYQSFIMGFAPLYAMFAEPSGYQAAFDHAAYEDFEGLEPFMAVAETGDMDFDAPDDDKTIYRFGLLASGTFAYRLEGSVRRGITGSWKTLASRLELLEGEQEAHFRLSGDKLTLRLTILDSYSTFAIEGFTMSVKTMGESVIRGGV